jgi:hypothetical protein
MSDKHPECPLYNPLNCKEYFNPKLCAFTRKDRSCLKKRKPKPQFDEGSPEDELGIDLKLREQTRSNPSAIPNGEPGTSQA